MNPPIDSINLEKREESLTLNRGMQGKYGFELKLYRKESETYEEFFGRLGNVTRMVEKEIETLSKLNLEDKNGKS